MLNRVYKSNARKKMYQYKKYNNFMNFKLKPRHKTKDERH